MPYVPNPMKFQTTTNLGLERKMVSYKDVCLGVNGHNMSEEDLEFFQEVGQEIGWKHKDGDGQGGDLFLGDPLCPVVRLTEEERLMIRTPWKRSILVKILGRRMGLKYFHSRIIKLWKPHALIECGRYGHEKEGYSLNSMVDQLPTEKPNQPVPDPLPQRHTAVHPEANDFGPWIIVQKHSHRNVRNRSGDAGVKVANKAGDGSNVRNVVSKEGPSGLRFNNLHVEELNGNGNVSVDDVPGQQPSHIQGVRDSKLAKDKGKAKAHVEGNSDAIIKKVRARKVHVNVDNEFKALVTSGNQGGNDTGMSSKDDSVHRDAELIGVPGDNSADCAMISSNKRLVENKVFLGATFHVGSLLGREPLTCHPWTSVNAFPRLPSDQLSSIHAIPTDSEILVVVQDMGPCKAPGPGELLG
ncbi:hypothetical protein SESBI_42174 [Sesbania bispinosa]|nr:hypothetical protein SESBI_42174 [Sesbania bispinosa]